MKDKLKLIKTLTDMGVIKNNREGTMLMPPLSDKDTICSTVSCLVIMAYCKGEMAGTKDSYEMFKATMRGAKHDTD